MKSDLHEIQAMLESKREGVLARLHRLEDITVERAPIRLTTWRCSWSGSPRSPCRTGQPLPGALHSRSSTEQHADAERRYLFPH